MSILASLFCLCITANIRQSQATTSEWKEDIMSKHTAEVEGTSTASALTIYVPALSMNPDAFHRRLSPMACTNSAVPGGECIIECSTDGPCYQQRQHGVDIECDTKYSKCTVICNGERSCSESNIKCGIPDVECRVYCTNAAKIDTDQDGACYQTEIHGEVASLLYVTGAGQRAAMEAQIWCPTAQAPLNSGCYVVGLGNNVYDTAIIDARLAMHLTVCAEGGSVFTMASMVCRQPKPRGHGDCTVSGVGMFVLEKWRNVLCLEMARRLCFL